MTKAFLVLIALLALPAAFAGGGGNCKNLCSNARKPKYYATCQSEHCNKTGACVSNAATACTCSEDCQECFADVYDQCGGCTDKNGYDFDKNDAPEIKKEAEAMGCNTCMGITTSALAIISCLAAAAML